MFFPFGKKVKILGGKHFLKLPPPTPTQRKVGGMLCFSAMQRKGA